MKQVSWLVLAGVSACTFVRPLDELGSGQDVLDDVDVLDDDVDGRALDEREESDGVDVSTVDDPIPEVKGDALQTGAERGTFASVPEAGADAGPPGAAGALSSGDGGAPLSELCQRDSDCSEGRCLEAGGGCVPCPSDMQLVRFKDGTAFCIDRLEVTQAQYSAFLGAVGDQRPDIDRRPPLCELNATLLPSDEGACLGAFAPGSTPALPVSCVDACDAVGYCTWVGKRLCGGKRGQPVGFNFWEEPDYDEWGLACNAGTTRLYPYGASFDPGACNVGSQAPVDVGSSERCTTDSGVWDLSGNVAEWSDYFRNAEDGTHAVVRGGSFSHRDPLGVGCNRRPTDGVDPVLVPSIYVQAPHIGFRCCVD